MRAPRWTLAEAKAKFSDIIERAMSEGAQTITKKSRTAAVVVGANERKTKQSAQARRVLRRVTPAGIETESPHK